MRQDHGPWAYPPRPRRPVFPAWVVVLVIALVAFAAGHVAMQAVQDLAHFHATYGG